MSILVLFPVVATIISDIARQVYQIKQGKLDKDEVLVLVRQALEGMALFKDSAREYQPLILKLAEEYLSALIHSYNLTGMWGRKIYISLPTGKEITI